MVKKKRKKKRGKKIDWSQELKAAEEALARNKARIEAAPRGIPGGKDNPWRVGKGPSSTPEKR